MEFLVLAVGELGRGLLGGEHAVVDDDSFRKLLAALQALERVEGLAFNDKGDLFVLTENDGDLRALSRK